MADRIFGAGPEDFAQAEWLADKMGREWRYDFTTEKWHHWTGVRWAPTERAYAANAVATIAANALVPQNRGNMTEERRKALMKLLSLPPAYRALEALATFDGYGTNGDDWDTDPYLLGCENGIVDLRTGELDEHPDPSTLVTKTTGHNYEPLVGDFRAAIRKRAPRFWKFLNEITAKRDTPDTGDEDMAAFLLQWFGSGIFGFTPEQKFVILTGIGRNGKGTLKNALLATLGEYASQSDQNLYMHSKHGAATSREARADLMDLKGTRVSFFSEPEGGRFNDELLKNHTGGDVIVARPLFSNNVAHWKATHSITFLVNDLPTVEDVGPSMADRVLVADFQQRYEGPKADTKLDERLAAEAEGILAALVWAAGIWYERREADLPGLVIPERVLEQSRSFIERNNPVAQAIAEAFAVGPGYQCSGQVAYDAYVEWHARSGSDDEPMSVVKFASALVKEGFVKFRGQNVRMWRGLKPLGAVEVADRDANDEE